MRRFLYLAAATLLTALSAGCAERGPSGTEFVLPEGDVAKGQDLFVSYGCNGCHVVPGLDLPEGDGPVRITLGGRVSKVKTYPELVTSIINPSHKFAPRRRAEEVSENGESLMTVYNDVMTVTELVNLVAFLESRYEELERPGYRYPTYSLSE
jgi:sulfur-oxidizing protein SoxX